MMYNNKSLIIRLFGTVCFIIVLVLNNVSAQHKSDLTFDILIRNACVFDGTGKDSVFVDVGVRGDRIVFVGESKQRHQAERVIDGEGLYLAPGFIDPHTHYDGFLWDEDPYERALMRCLSQGVTTIFAGNDGAGPWPIGGTLSELEKLGIGVNIGLFAPHGTVRAKVLGYRNIGASDEQIEKMKDLVEQAMEEGAFGLSTGLFYTPGFFSSTDEVIALSKVAAAYGGIYDTHQRDEGTQNIGVINSVKEVFEIGEKANIPVHISHIKVMGTPVWGKSTEIIQMVEEAQQKGLKVTANQYPYVASQTGLSAAVIPSWVREGGRSAMRKRFDDDSLRDSILAGITESIRVRSGTADKLVLATRDKFLRNKSLGEVARIWDTTPEEAAIRILKEKSPPVHSYGMTEEDLTNFMGQPWVMVGSDGRGGHPRAYGTFPRVIRRYAMELGILTVAQAIHKSTGLTAETLNIKGRGLIKEGYFADLVLFDPLTIKDNATFEDVDQLASGVHYVLVNGKITIDHGNHTGVLEGRGLRLN